MQCNTSLTSIHAQKPHSPLSVESLKHYFKGWKKCSEMYKNVIKRVIDISLSFIGIIVLLPIFLLVGIIIYIDDPGPVLFKQKRMGKDKKPFWLYKFRSMKMNTPEMPGYCMDDPEQYITRFGHIIRYTSIDELPQIYNIFIGDMSIIGYRPSLYENEDELVEKRDKYSIYSCKPGLTGWAQINGRDSITVDSKVKFDEEYIKVLNGGGPEAFKMDCKIFWGSVAKVLKQSDVTEGRIAVELEKNEGKKEAVHK